MEITTNEENGICIAALSGKLNTANATDAESALMELLDQGKHSLLLDFSGVDYIASSGLRVLLKLAQRMKNEGGNLRLCSANDSVNNVFRISGFDKILEIHESKQQALQGFGEAAGV